MSVNDYRNPVTDKLFEVKPGKSENSRTFVFGNEDHTLGNALRHVAMQRLETEFCGYSVPHPSEPKMNVRIQTNGEATAYEVLDASLKDLHTITEHMEATFAEALARYKREHA